MSLEEIFHDRSLLVGGELWLCIAQLARSKGALRSEQRNKDAADAIEALLSCDDAGVAPIDRDCDCDSLTRLLILPELSLGWEDWGAVDAAVKKYNKSIIVVAGMGFTAARSLRERVTFLGANVSDERNVNYGCIWINLREDGGAHSVSEVHYYCKNFAEQSSEIPAFDPYLGSSHLVIRFRDCVIAPVICADLLADSQAGKMNAIDKLREYRTRWALPIVVAANVLQDRPWHEIWSSRIDRAVDGNLILTLANFSHGNRPSKYADDTNRNLSGAYAQAGLVSRSSPRTIACNTRDSHASRGVVVRDSCSVFVAGVLRVCDFSATTGRYLWVSRWAQEITRGVFCPIGTRLKFEIPRLCRRTRHLSPSSEEGIGEVEAHLVGATDSRRAGFFRSIVNGPISSSNDPDPSSECSLNTATEAALIGVDALIRAPFLNWPQSDGPTMMVSIAGPDGVVVFSSEGYVWRSSSETWSKMSAKLQGYAESTSPLPAIVVFGEDMDAVDLSPDDVMLSRDTATPVDLDGDFDLTTPRLHSNTVVVLPLSPVKRLSGQLNDREKFGEIAEKIRASIVGSIGVAL